MHQYQHYYGFPQASAPTNFSGNGIVAIGLAGAMITAIGATAHGLRKAQQGASTYPEMIGAVAKEAIGGGLASAAGAAVAANLFGSRILSLLAMAAVGIGVKYFYDGMTDSLCALNVSQAQSTEPTNDA